MLTKSQPSNGGPIKFVADEMAAISVKDVFIRLNEAATVKHVLTVH